MAHRSSRVKADAARPRASAAAALTRRTRWASGLSCGRQDVPADRTVDPRYIVTKHRVEDGDDLAHHSDEDDLGFLSGGREAIVEGSELGIATAADQSRHVQHAPHRRTAAPDGAWSSAARIPPAIPIWRSRRC